MKSIKPEIDTHDIVIIGAGMSGLLLVRSLLNHPQTAQSRILLLDKSPEDYPPRTWCYWDTAAKDEPGLQKTWEIAECLLGDERLELNLKPFRYNMIDAEAWRKQLLRDLSKHSNISLIRADVRVLGETENHVLIHAENKIYRAAWAFDSRWDPSVLQSYNGHVLYQQFLGWNIVSSDAFIDAERARLMDFRVGQTDAVAFCYVLPLEPRRALVEYTLFTPTVRSWEDLETSLQSYMKQHYPSLSFRIERSEKGVIPMTDFPFARNSRRIVSIGTAGGCTKPSTGYTFAFARQHAEAITIALAARKRPPHAPALHASRFPWYDKIMLGVLEKQLENGASILFRLFKKNDPATVLRFLNNQSSLWEEIRLFTTLPTRAFLKSAIASISSSAPSPQP